MYKVLQSSTSIRCAWHSRSASYQGAICTNTKNRRVKIESSGDLADRRLWNVTLVVVF